LQDGVLIYQVYNKNFITQKELLFISLFGPVKMSSPKRRLSNSSAVLKMCDDDSDDDEMSVSSVQEKSIYTFPKKSSSRRKSSIGGLNSSKSPVNAAEQARITEMYKTVIQMSSENVSTVLGHVYQVYH
jgi:hypothetical protein